MSPSLGRGLQQMLDLPAADVEAVGQAFEVSYEAFGEVKTVALKEGGADVAVSSANRAEYVQLYVEWYLERSVKTQFDAFRRGLVRVCGGEVRALRGAMNSTA